MRKHRFGGKTLKGKLYEKNQEMSKLTGVNSNRLCNVDVLETWYSHKLSGVTFISVSSEFQLIPLFSAGNF